MNLKKIRKKLKKSIAAVIVTAVFFCSSIPAYATGTGVSEVDSMFNNFSSFISGIVTAVGGLITLFGIVRFAISFQSHDPSQRSQGLLFIVSGILIAVAPQIVKFVTG